MGLDSTNVSKVKKSSLNSSRVRRGIPPHEFSGEKRAHRSSLIGLCVHYERFQQNFPSVGE